MDSVTLLASHSREFSSSLVLAGYGAVAASLALVLIAVVRLLRGGGHGFRVLVVATALAVASTVWLNDTWASWYRQNCVEHTADFCADMRAATPLWPFAR